MKPGGSSLNPYAAAYVPLFKREPATEHVQHQPQVAHGYGGVQGTGCYPGSQMSMPKQMRDEDLEMDMDIEFLLVTFSGLSHESINDVYMANSGDLDATIEMLNQLEIYSSEAQEYLPDTLDIGDVPETTETSKPKNASTEATSASSSSGTPNAAVSSS
uniref:Polyadenylate-binding protein-interacting protein 6 n=1 Tax=Noccaea caerulescens TaxID=107243 RepID=A0A1J3ISC6_NOCCA